MGTYKFVSAYSSKFTANAVQIFYWDTTLILSLWKYSHIFKILSYQLYHFGTQKFVSAYISSHKFCNLHGVNILRFFAYKIKKYFTKYYNKCGILKTLTSFKNIVCLLYYIGI
jgi:hypothetical protein